MDKFIHILGYYPDAVTYEIELDEFANANDCIDTYARFLLNMGYARESVRAALREVGDEF